MHLQRARTSTPPTRRARNNRQLTGSVTNFWNGGRPPRDQGRLRVLPQPADGRQLAVVDVVRVQRRLPRPTRAGAPVLDATGRLIPVFVPGGRRSISIRRSRAPTLNVDNNSLYVQDHWTINSALVGRSRRPVRAREGRSRPATSSASSTNRIVPRLAVGYDVKGNGNHVVHVTYGQYSGRYNEAQIGANSPVGIPRFRRRLYQGPAGRAALRARVRPGELSDHVRQRVGGCAAGERLHGSRTSSRRSRTSSRVSYGRQLRRAARLRRGQPMSPARRTA